MCQRANTDGGQRKRGGGGSGGSGEGVLDAIEYWGYAVQHPAVPPEMASIIGPTLSLLLDAVRPKRLSLAVLRSVCRVVCRAAEHVRGAQLFLSLRDALARIAGFDWGSDLPAVQGAVTAATGDLLAYGCGGRHISKAEVKFSRITLVLNERMRLILHV
jgi:hypothetical protein